ncbi:MAG: hypothetical protein KGJ27_12345, partial [candidate division NC10 bacterium]|nr:hypothetical protein [candidate division NC10 bacterium]
LLITQRSAISHQQLATLLSLNAAPLFYTQHIPVPQPCQHHHPFMRLSLRATNGSTAISPSLF